MISLKDLSDMIFVDRLDHACFLRLFSRKKVIAKSRLFLMVVPTSLYSLHRIVDNIKCKN